MSSGVVVFLRECPQTLCFFDDDDVELNVHKRCVSSMMMMWRLMSSDVVVCLR